MNIQINTDELKQSLSKYHLSDLVLFMAWIFIHIGLFSKMNANDFFVFTGVVNFGCALVYKMIKNLVNWKI